MGLIGPMGQLPTATELPRNPFGQYPRNCGTASQKCGTAPKKWNRFCKRVPVHGSTNGGTEGQIEHSKFVGLYNQAKILVVNSCQT